MNIDLSPEELALCVAALRERAKSRDNWEREAGLDYVPPTPEERGRWAREAFQSASLAAKIEDELSHATLSAERSAK